MSQNPYLAVIGFLFGITASGLYALANVTSRNMALQKAQGLTEKLAKYKRIILASYVMGTCGDLLGLHFAPLALVGATSAFGIPFSALLSSERIEGGHRQGTILIFSALLLIPTFGPHNVNDDFGVDDLYAALESQFERSFIALNVLVAVMAAALAWIWRNEVKGTSTERPLVPYSFLLDVLVWAFLTSDLAAWLMLLGKVSMSIIANLNNWYELLESVPVLTAFAAVAASLPNMVLKTTGRFPSASIIPVYQTTTMLITTVHGGVFLAEFADFNFATWQGAVYLGSFFMAGLGIWLLNRGVGEVRAIAETAGLGGSTGTLLELVANPSFNEGPSDVAV